MYDVIRTLEDVESEYRERTVPAGTEGTVVEIYQDPEGYAVDLAIPCSSLSGGCDYENVVLKPDQFVLIESSEET
jgi:hypothetical protein